MLTFDNECLVVIFNEGPFLGTLFTTVIVAILANGIDYEASR